MPAPIALFAYNRPQHLQNTIEALLRNPEARNSRLYVFADAPKNEAAEVGVAKVREVLRDVRGFAEVYIEERDRNFGLSRNITTGVSRVLEQYENVIVIEDDIVVSRYFLRFMNEALLCYRNEQTVGSITGYRYPTSRRLPETFFIRGADCWGWATWRDRWRLYNPDGVALLNELNSRGLGYAFDFDGTMGFISMLKDQIAGNNDSWAVRWYASCFLLDKLILYPGRSLVENIGNDGSGTHVKSETTTFDVDLSDTPVRVGGIDVVESALGRLAFKEFFDRSNPKHSVQRPFSYPRRLIEGIRRALRQR